MPPFAYVLNDYTASVALYTHHQYIAGFHSSRLIADKYLLGFRFPCDGPGRGGYYSQELVVGCTCLFNLNIPYDSFTHIS